MSNNPDDSIIDADDLEGVADVGVDADAGGRETVGPEAPDIANGTPVRIRGARMLNLDLPPT